MLIPSLQMKAFPSEAGSTWTRSSYLLSSCAADIYSCNSRTKDWHVVPPLFQLYQNQSQNITFGRSLSSAKALPLLNGSDVEDRPTFYYGMSCEVCHSLLQEENMGQVLCTYLQDHSFPSECLWISSNPRALDSASLQQDPRFIQMLHFR